MQGFELAAISVPPSDFHNFFEVATGHRRNAGNRAGGHFLSSLFSLLSFLCSVIAPFLCARLAEQDPCIFAGDYEASRPPTLQKCSDSRRPRGQQTLLSINLAISGRLFCDLFSLLSFLFSRCCSTRESANPVAVQLQFSCSLFLQGSSRFSLRSSLVSRCCSFLRSHFAPVPSIFASGHRRRPQLLRPFAAPSLARRNARSD